MKFLWQSFFNSQLDSMTESGPENRIRRLEQKVNILLALAVFQSGVLCFLFASSLVPGPFTLVLLAVMVIVAIILLNKFIPGWGRFCGRIVASLFRRKSNDGKTAKPNDSLKEDF